MIRFRIVKLEERIAPSGWGWGFGRGFGRDFGGFDRDFGHRGFDHDFGGFGRRCGFGRW